MKGTNGQVQTVSIMDTISQLATNQGDRAKITQLSSDPSKTTRINTSATSNSPSKASFSSLSLSSGARYQPPPPVLTPPSKFLATNINISQMSLPVTNRFNTTKLSASNNTNLEEFSSGLETSGFLSSTLAVQERPVVRDSRRRTRGRRSKRGVEVRGQGETPDWIRQLFGLAKKGNLERLKEALGDMERTMIRNLSDHLGNNLLHVVSRHGLVLLLPWLAARLGPELNPALSDENKQGLTPVVLAIKFGRLETVRWLVEKTRDGERLASREGERERCLLHTAARYGQDTIASWLCEEMTRDGLELDQLDLGGNTPLHLAARNGNTNTASTLLNLGARVNIKNDLGLKPSDCATLRGKDSTAEFLIMFETSLGITKELLQREKLQEQLLAESAEMKTNFKDVVSVSKKLAKEREEMCRDLSRLHESMIELHDKMIMQIQILAQENTSLKKNGVKDNSSVKVADSIAECDGLHEKWQAHQAQYFSSSLADLEHRILLAEDNIKKHKPSPAPPDQSYAHRSLRDRLEEMRGGSSSLSGARKMSPTCSSDTVTSPDESGDDHSEADTNFYEAMRTPTSSGRTGYNIAQRKKLATPSPIKVRESHNESLYSSLSSPMYSTIGSQELRTEPGLDYHSAKVAASELARTGMGQSPVRVSSGGKEDRRRSRSDLKKRLKQLALTSETGSASVIEVIEPNSSEEEEFKKSLQEMNISWGKSLSVHQAEPQTPVVTPLVRSRRLTAEPQSRAEKTEKQSKNLPASEPNVPSGVRNVGQDNSQDSITVDNEAEPVIDDDGDELYNEDFSDVQLLSYDMDSDRCDSSLQMKKRGFLQKLSISKWAQKKRSSKGPGGKAKEIGAEYFRETYLSPRSEGAEAGVTRISVGQEDADLHNRLSKSLSPATRKSGPHHHDKGLTVATSDDSGIIARPLSSASKSETSLSRPDSSSSDPPARQETTNTTTIITLDTNNVNNNNKTAGAVVKTKTSRSKKREEKPWYDVSDEDVEIPTPEHITSIISVRGSSDEEAF